MAIQNRRGKEADFDPSKMLPGEFAVTTDGSRKVYAAFAPGDVKELASKEEVQGIVDDFKENVDKQTEEVVQAIDDKGKEVIDRIPDYDTKISTLQQSKATAIVSTLKGETLVTNSSAAIPPRNLKLFGKSLQNGEPSINNPQEIQSLGSGGSIGGKVLGGNLIDYHDNTNKFVKQDNGKYQVTKNHDGWVVGDMIPLKNILSPNKTYTLQCGDTEYTQAIVKTTVGGVIKYLATHNYGKIPISFTPTEEELENAVFYLQLQDVKPQGTYEVWCMLNEGNTALPFEPYTEQPFTFQTPNGLRGIPLGQTIPDAIKNSPIHMSGVYWDSVEQQYYIGDTKNEDGKDVQRILKKTFDGSDDEGWMIQTGITVGNRYSIFINENVLISDITNGVTSMNTNSQIGASGSSYSTPNVYTINVNVGKSMLFVSLNGTETLEEFKGLLAEKPMSGYFVLAEPIITDITEEDQAQHDSIHMNYPNTTIVNDAGAYMEVEYVEDTELYLAGNYVPISEHNALESRVSALEQMALN